MYYVTCPECGFLYKVFDGDTCFYCCTEIKLNGGGQYAKEQKDANTKKDDNNE